MAKERRHRDDWLSEWNEVQDHRYDPGHWLGRLHPFYRRLASTGTVSFGVELIAVGLLSAVAAFWQPPVNFRGSFGALAIFFLLLGISNIRAARRTSNLGRGTIKDYDPRRDLGHDPRE